LRAVVLPAYSEEIGLRHDLPRLRLRYAAEADPARKAELLAQARKSGRSALHRAAAFAPA
jgi:hypothetical protein